MATVTKPIILDETGQDIVAALQTIASHAAGLVGQGVPSGGTTGQVLKKKSNTDYDTEWGAESSVSPYTSNPAALGTADPGSSANYARGDHVHPKPTASDLGITVPSASSATPQALGTAAAGSSSDYSRADHVHEAEVFWVTYGTTTFSAISAAVAANKAVLCVYNAHVYYLTGCSSNPNLPIADFTSKSGTTIDGWLKCNGSTWTNGTVRVAPEEVTVSTAGDVSKALDAGKIYHFTGALTSLTITMNAADSGNVAQYHFDFDSGSTAPTVTATGVTWPDGSFTPEASKHYEVDILNGYGVAMAW